MMSGKRINRWHIFLVLVAALIFRLWYFVELRQSPPFGFPIIDSREIQQQAAAMARGVYPYQRAFFKAPLYPHLMGFFYRLVGIRYSPFHLLQFVLGALNCVLIYLLGRRILPPWAALGTGLAAALYKPFIYFNGELLTPTLLNCLNLLMVLRLAAGYTKHRKRYFFLAGLMGGLSAVTRSPGLLFAPAMVLWALLHKFGLRRSRRVRRFYLYALLFVAGMAAVIAPVTWWNYHLERDLVLVSSNGGINFYTGNNENADGTTSVLPGIRWERLLRLQSSWGITNSSGLSRAWWEEGLFFIQDKPVQALKLLARKLLLFIKDRELRNNKDPLFMQRFSSVLKLPLPGFGLIFPLAVMGIIASVRSWHRYCQFYLVPAVILTVNIAFFTCGRYRVTAVPFLLCFAGLGVVRAADLWKAKNHRILLRYAGLAAVLWFMTWQPWLPILETTFARDYFNLGNIYWQRGDAERAGQCYRNAVELDPADPDLYIGLGLMHEQRNELDRAAAVYREGLALAPDHADLLANLGSVVSRIGDYRNGGDILVKALELQPGNPAVYFNLGVCLEAAGSNAGAVQAYKKALRSGASRADVFNNLGCLYLRMGINREAALDMLEEAVRLKPRDGLIRDSLGWGYYLCGRYEESLAELKTAYKLLPGSATVILHLAQASAAAGDRDETITLLERLRERFPGTLKGAEAARLLMQLESRVQPDGNEGPGE